MQSRSEETRSRVIEAAWELFSRNGLEGVSVQDISTKSGVSNGSIFHHFGSKNGVALEVYLRERGTYWTAVLEALEAAGDEPLDALGAAACAALAYQEKHIRRHIFMIECASSDWVKEHAADVRALNQTFIDRFTAWGAPHLKSGALKAMDPELYAAFVFGPTQWLARAWSTDLRDRAPTEYADEVATIVAKAFKP